MSRSTSANVRPLAPGRLKFIRCLFGVIGLGVGILLVIAGRYHQLDPHDKMAAWVKTPCRILQWGVTLTHGPGGDLVLPHMAYQYTFGGKVHASANYDEADWEVDLRDFEEEGAAARRGPAFCYVNPAKPAQASFRAARLWFPYSLIGGGGLLALVSLIFIVRTFFPSRFTRGLTREERQQIFSRRMSLGLGLFILGMGLHLGNSQGILDAVRGQLLRSELIQKNARVEGVVITQKRGSGRNSHRTYNMVRLVYSYEHAGRRWHSDRWYFDSTEVNAGAITDARALKTDYPPGHEMGCWIHPEKPWLATLHPGLRWYFLMFLFPVAFIIGGVWLSWHGLGRLRPEGRIIHPGSFRV